jgi:hypothetical protein
VTPSQPVAIDEDDPDRLAGDLLARFGSLGAVAAADLSELTRSSDAGLAVLTDLKILRELAVRLARVEACHRPAIASWTALQAYARPHRRAYLSGKAAPLVTALGSRDGERNPAFLDLGLPLGLVQKVRTASEPNKVNARPVAAITRR